ncbi:MAG: hypothetical protein D6734_05315 [Candidatus Schekmanbacteria bacterium]|nr:MAG: hypothetical protein D6734_05315 [Candidatus Schekmanbacteria bacterium]
MFLREYCYHSGIFTLSNYFGSKIKTVKIRTVKIFLYISFLLLFLLSCISIGKPPKKYEFPFTKKFYTNDRELIHHSIVDFLHKKGFEIIEDRGVPGKITTDWTELDSLYYYGTFEREGTTDYCDCGKPDMNWTYETKRGKLVVQTEERGDYIQAMVVASFNTFASYRPCIAIAIRNPEEDLNLLKKCESKGKLENELFQYLELKIRKGADYGKK